MHDILHIYFHDEDDNIYFNSRFFYFDSNIINFFLLFANKNFYFQTLFCNFFIFEIPKYYLDIKFQIKLLNIDN